MKVDDVYAAGSAAANQAALQQAGQAQQPEKVSPACARTEPGATAPLEADRVQLSDLSEKLAATLGPNSPERAARLERLAAEVQAGRYRVDPMAVSARIVDETLRGG